MSSTVLKIPTVPMTGISPVCGCLQSPLWYIAILSLNHLLLTLNRCLLNAKHINKQLNYIIITT